MRSPRACWKRGVIRRSVSKARELALECGPEAKARTAKERSGERRR